MDQRTIMAMNWMALILLAPATIILVWKMVSEKFKGKEFSPDLITVALLLGSAVIGVAELNIHRVGWLSLALLVGQLILVVFLFRRLWSPLKEKLRG